MATYLLIHFLRNKYSKKKCLCQSEILCYFVLEIKEDIVNEMKVNLAADLHRREETRQLLETCKQKEDQIRKELETENQIRIQGARFEKLMPSLKKSIVTLLELWSSLEDKTLFCQVDNSFWALIFYKIIFFSEKIYFKYFLIYFKSTQISYFSVKAFLLVQSFVGEHRNSWKHPHRVQLHNSFN